MHPWPTVDWDEPDVVVDVSNVCRADELPGTWSADLDRVPLVIDALGAHLHHPELRVAPITDRSLADYLPPQQQSRYRQLLDGNLLRATAHADPHILDLAELTGARVLSLDQFGELRHDYPWIQGNDDSFFGWDVDGGQVTVKQRWMPAISPFDVSVKKERKQRPHHRRGSWRCDRCGWGPPVEGKRCATCGQERRFGPPAEGAFGVVLEVADDEIERRVLGEPDEWIIGRTVLTQAETLVADETEHVSRRHLRIWNDGKGLLYEDLGSANGTRHLRWDAREGRYTRRALVRPHVPHAFGRNDALLLADLVMVRQSGRLNPWGLPIDSTPMGDEGPTQMRGKHP